MKIREGFVLRKMPGMNIVMPAGAAAKEFRKTVVLNDTAAFIFELFQKGESPASASETVMKTYGIDHNTAAHAVEATASDLKEAGLLVE